MATIDGHLMGKVTCAKPLRARSAQLTGNPQAVVLALAIDAMGCEENAEHLIWNFLPTIQPRARFPRQAAFR